MENVRSIGLDIGTTTICAVVLDGETGAVLETVTKENNSFIKGSNVWERIQDVSIIMQCSESMVNGLTKKHSPVLCIGLTGQMHGIVYLDEAGSPVSSLYTWQDGRGDLVYKEGQSYAQYLSNATGYKLATGFGAVTHFYNCINDLVPSDAKCFCTIHDYIAMKLSNESKPLLHASNAASIGFFDMEKNCFDFEAIRLVGMDPAFFPEISNEMRLGDRDQYKIPVSVAIGDNQASFMGAVKSNEEYLSINIGTSSQISVYTNYYNKNSPVETRPFIDGGFLLVGAPLCGGRAYALLEGFFRDVVQMATGKETPRLYDVMDRYALEYLSEANKLDISTRFSGTRQDPSLRGSISNLGIDNFTPGYFVVGVLEGIAKELFDIYQTMKPMLKVEPKKIICSGNGVRLNKPLQKIISNMFDMPLSIPFYKEEAAYGAALFALAAAELSKSVGEAQSLIRYE